jgi:glycosyltransferase involved in cell wall biosynthesis
VSPSTEEAAERTPRITVAFLLYNAAGDVGALLEGLVRQVHPSFPRQSDWLEAVLVDDASRDGTAEAAAHALAGIGSPSHYRLVVHPRNLGLAETLNETFHQARSPYVLTCHLDTRFGSDDYVARMLALIEAHPRVAAITGQPALPPGARLPFAEKFNVVANLMDILPVDSSGDLVPVGFAEGRCDVFRVEALRRVGLYDTQLRVSGEDQVLAAKLRENGYEVYQAPRVVYHLSVSAEQDSVGKILRHQRLFGRTTPYIVLAVPGSLDGLVGRSAGANRSRRALLRATQLAASAVYALVPISLLVGWPGWVWLGALGLVAAAKVALFARHARAVRFSAGELLAFVLLQPPLDIAYTAGILEGLLRLARGGRSVPID